MLDPNNVGFIHVWCSRHAEFVAGDILDAVTRKGRVVQLAAVEESAQFFCVWVFWEDDLFGCAFFDCCCCAV